MRSKCCVKSRCAYLDCSFWISSWSSSRWTRSSRVWIASDITSSSHAQHGFDGGAVLAIRNGLGDFRERIEPDEPIERQAPLAVVLEQQGNEKPRRRITHENAAHGPSAL